MANKKKSDGVMGTIERVTGAAPCPSHLRNCLNKYLYEPGLFEGARKIGSKRQGKLIQSKTDALVRNLLDLDTIFRGDTGTVADIVQGSISGEALTAKLDAAQRDIQQRLDAYAYWMQRFSALKELLAIGDLDLKQETLASKLEAAQVASSSARRVPFALRAIQELERIETRGGPGKLSAKELTEQADAYLALGDIAHAAEKACAALAVDNSYSRAWFIRVMAALRRRNTALNEMQCQQMIATEIAEPMSSQERMAQELADEASSNALRDNEDLDKILPHALLHWPKPNAWQYEHQEQRRIVLELFINQTFMRAIVGNSRTNHEFLSEMNGFGPEETFERQQWPALPELQTSGESCLPFNEAEMQALQLLMKERDKYPTTFFDLVDGPSTGKELKLLHLRWVLKLDGYERHWGEISSHILSHPELYLKHDVLGDRWISRIWHMHQCLNGGYEAITTTLERWRDATGELVRSRCNSSLLEQYGLLFHHRFVREQYEDCSEISRRAQVIGDGSWTNHPLNDAISMPIGSPLYWRYLECLSTIRTAVKNPSGLQPSAIELLLDAEPLAKAFQDVKQCFWIESQELAEGCIEDFELPPYDMDLRDMEAWMKALQALISVPITASREAVDNLAARLSRVERPYAPLPFKCDMHSTAGDGEI